MLKVVCQFIKRLPCWVLLLDNADNFGLFRVGDLSYKAPYGDAPAQIPVLNLCELRYAIQEDQFCWKVGIKISLIAWSRLQTLRTDKMTLEEAKQLLDMNLSTHELYDVTDLMDNLQCLPLAIFQAAAYMRKTKASVRGYLHKLMKDEKRWQILGKEHNDVFWGSTVHNSILKTWNISIDHVQQENILDCKIIGVITFLDS